jgi:hypothetical protein
VGGEIFSTCLDRPWSPPSLLYNGYRAFPGDKERPGRDADPSPLSSAVVIKGYSYTSTPPMGRTVCTESQCLYSRAIPLLPLWAVRPVQSFSACTVERSLYPPYGRTACTEPQCLYSTAIPLLPLWSSRPLRVLSACTVSLCSYCPSGH